MKKSFIKYLSILAVIPMFTACLKSNPLAEDFSSVQPIADIPKAAANAISASAPTTSWYTLDSTAAGVDYATAVHISAANHIGDVTVKMKIDKAAAQTWITNHPTAGYTLLPDSLYTVPTLDVTIPNAGVFTTADFIVHIKTGDKGSSPSVFKKNKFILPISIDAVPGTSYGIASNFQTVLWYIKVK